MVNFYVFALLLLPCLSETVAEKQHRAKLVACALIASESLKSDPGVARTLAASVHPADVTQHKLNAEIALNCFRSVPVAYAESLIDEFSLQSPETQALIRYEESRYLRDEGDLEVTERELDLLLEMARLMQREGVEEL